MKVNQKIVILLSLSLSSLQVSDLLAPNFKGCVSVVEGSCQQCYRRKLLPNGNGCGPLQPPSDKCQFYTYSGDVGPVCLGCKQGYTNAEVSSRIGTLHECKPGSIAYCLDEATGVYGTESCYLCSGGRYSVAQPGGKTRACVRINNSVANCKEGASASSVQRSPPKCGLCEDGFAVEVNTGQCLRTPETGCWVADPKRCISCNPYAGYSMGPDGKCF